MPIYPAHGRKIWKILAFSQDSRYKAPHKKIKNFIINGINKTGVSKMATDVNKTTQSLRFPKTEHYTITESEIFFKKDGCLLIKTHLKPESPEDTAFYVTVLCDMEELFQAQERKFFCAGDKQYPVKNFQKTNETLQAIHAFIKQRGLTATINTGNPFPSLNLHAGEIRINHSPIPIKKPKFLRDIMSGKFSYGGYQVTLNFNDFRNIGETLNFNDFRNIGETLARMPKPAPACCPT